MDKAKVFVIMPFSDEFFESYELMKTHFEEKFEFSHAGSEDNQQNILADIIPPIYNADIVLADLTGLNPNVMYELGVAHSFNKKTIVITRDDVGTLPFDLKQYRAKGYTTHFKEFYDLLSYLDKNFQGAVDGNVIFSNPVRDFLEKNRIDPNNLFNRDNISIEVPDSEKGFIDFIADIEDDIEKITENIEQMSSELDTMSNGINCCIEKIESAQKVGGNGTASLFRKQSKKAAEFIATFSKELKMHNEAIVPLWEKVEKNTFGLLENQYTSREENKQSMIDYFKVLYGMKSSIEISNEAIKEMQKSALNNLGIERSMNQSIRFLDEDLTAYLTMTEQMQASIDRILHKGKFVVGHIDYTQEAAEHA